MNWAAAAAGSLPGTPNAAGGTAAIDTKQPDQQPQQEPVQQRCHSFCLAAIGIPVWAASPHNQPADAVKVRQPLDLSRVGCHERAETLKVRNLVASERFDAFVVYQLATGVQIGVVVFELALRGSVGIPVRRKGLRESSSS